MDTKDFRFVGTESIISDQHMQQFGQVIKLTEDEATRLVAAHPPALIVSPESWAKAGITEAERSDWPSVLVHDQAPAEFVAKRNALWDAMHAAREAAVKTVDAAAPAAAPKADSPSAPAEPITEQAIISGPAKEEN